MPVLPCISVELLYFLMGAFVPPPGAELPRPEECVFTVTQLCGSLKAKEQSHVCLLILRPVNPGYMKDIC